MTLMLLHRPLARLLNRHERHLQWLFQGHQSLSRQWLQQHGSDDPEFADWLSVRLRVPGAPERMQQLPVAVRQQWQGWQDYYQGRYAEAAQAFWQAWAAVQPQPNELEPDLGAAADVALGLGKVYTRSGHWQAARAWLLYALGLARSEQRLFTTTEGYGALGELLLRAGHEQAAHHCMGTAYQLLPPGAGQQAKQLNYLASALMRCGELLRAESLLMTSLHMAIDQGDTDSVWHALARLQFLQLQQPDTATQRDIGQTLRAYQPAQRTPVACGFLAIGRALWLVQRGQRDQASTALEQARCDLGQHLPMERLWVQRLQCAIAGQAWQPDPTTQALLQLPVHLPPPGHSVLDHTWGQLPLPPNNGFATLFEPDSTLAQQAQAWRVFFV